MEKLDFMTAEEFAEKRDLLPDGGRWTELVAGRIVPHSPPEIEHGTAVLNVGKALAAAAESPENEEPGYACFELGLLIERRPDTIWCPAISYFTLLPRFGESDKIYTDNRPALVVELASSNDRRERLDERVRQYLEWGVRVVWVLDTVGKQVHVFGGNRQPQHLKPPSMLQGNPVIAGLKVPVEELFREPAWWNVPRKVRGVAIVDEQPPEQAT